MNSKEAGKHNRCIIMLIYANKAMTSHQYNIWTKGIVWEQLYGLLCEFCEHFSLKAQVSYCCPSSF